MPDEKLSNEAILEVVRDSITLHDKFFNTKDGVSLTTHMLALAAMVFDFLEHGCPNEEEHQRWMGWIRQVRDAIRPPQPPPQAKA